MKLINPRSIINILYDLTVVVLRDLYSLYRDLNYGKNTQTRVQGQMNIPVQQIKVFGGEQRQNLCRPFHKLFDLLMHKLSCIIKKQEKTLIRPGTLVV